VFSFQSAAHLEVADDQAGEKSAGGSAGDGAQGGRNVEDAVAAWGPLSRNAIAMERRP